MSWDIFVQDIPDAVRSVSEIADDYEPPSIGRRADIISRIQEIVPTADFRTYPHGVIEGADFSIEVSMEDAELLTGFAFHVHGGDLAVCVISDILRHLGLRALDPNTPNGLFQFDESTGGFARWKNYKDRLIIRTPKI